LNRKKVVFLTEGSNAIGLGHVTRCLALSQAFFEEGCTSKFMIHGDDSYKSILNHPNCRRIDWLNGIDEIKLDLQNAIIVVDTFSISEKLLAELSCFGKVSILDDFIRREHSNRLVIDWTINSEKIFYTKKNESSKYLLGHNYIALRRPFWDREEFVLHPDIRNVLIMFGSGDIRNLCTYVSKLLNKFDSSLMKTMVISSASPNRLAAEKMVDSKTRLVIDANANEVFALMKNSDLAIASGGQTLYELACVGVPTISVMLIDNQADDIQGWNEVGFTSYAGQWDGKELDLNILRCLRNLTSLQERQRRSEIGQSLVDGQGARRVVRYILNENHDC
jgi:UDP-2,4-diacetamido-2,4,6-trideoxy-beta-L-altropyranose hydrolase